MKRLKFQNGIVLMNIVIMVFLVSSLFLYFYLFVIRTEEKRTMENLETIALKSGDQLDLLMHDLDDLALRLASDPVMTEGFKDLPKDEGNYFDREPVLRKTLNDRLYMHIFATGHFSRICLYNDYEDIIYTGLLSTDSGKISRFFQSARYDDICKSVEQGNGRAIIPPREDPFGTEQGTEPMIFSVVREISDYNTYSPQKYGYVEIQQSSDRIDKILELSDQSIKCYIVDRSRKNTMFPIKEELAPEIREQEVIKQVLEKFEWRKGKSYIEEEGKYFAAAFNLEELPQCTLLLIQEKGAALQNLYSFFAIIAVVLLFLMVSVAFIQFLGTRYMVYPLIELRRSLDHISIEDMELSMDFAKFNNELDMLQYAFNQMMRKLNESFSDLMISKTNELEAELLALQAQINPHFIHNTLTIIQVACEENDTEKVELICRSLTNMLQFSTGYQSPTCTLEKELEYCESYLQLMKARYEDLFDYEIERTGELSAEVPKLCIFPLLENCFAHGFKKKSPPWKIKLVLSQDDSGWQGKLWDNGTGFDEALLESILQSAAGLTAEETMKRIKSLKIGGIGIQNTLLRMKIMYKEDFIFKIQNVQPEGTEILLGGRNDTDYGSGR